jgi:NAD(P)-dependent dehydrogenase (short-subunit alcohol dehydrogenase family)
VQRLAGKVVLVVGGGTDPAAVGDDAGELAIGNGRATAIVCAREGAHVVVADRERAAAQETVHAITTEGLTADAVTCDVTVEDQCRDAVEVAVRTFGALHGLVNNVGIGDARSIVNTSADDLDRSYAVNLRGHFLMMKHALPAIEQAGGGAIVNVSSINAVRSAAGVAYEITKAALHGLTRNVAVSAGRKKVRVNSVLPGAIDSPMLRLALTEAGANPEVVLDRITTRIPLGRTGTPWEVATAIAFLLSDDASYISGIDLLVDGGLSAPQP